MKLHPKSHVIFAIALGSVIFLNASFSFPQLEEYWDLGAFHLAGWNVLNGLSPYSFESREEWRQVFSGSMTGPNVNAPASLLFFVPLSFLSPSILIFLWYGGSMFLFLGLVALLVVEEHGRAPLAEKVFIGTLFLALSGAWHGIELLQLYPLLAALVYLAAKLAENGNKSLAGCLLGSVVALKPQFLFALAFLYFAKEQRIALIAFSMTCLLNLTACLFFGPEVFNEWILAVLEKQDQLSSQFLLQMSPITPLVLLPYSEVLKVASLGLLCVYSSLVGMRYTKNDLTTKISLGMIGPLLLLPFSWIGYLILLYPLMVRHYHRPLVFVSLLVFVVPFYFVYPMGTGLRAQNGFSVFELVYPISFLSLSYGLLRASVNQFRKEAIEHA